jgi:phosphoribosylamine-glycine ligase
MNILLIGNGGREHALAWKLGQSPSCDTLYGAPGNPGIAEEADLVDVNVRDHGAVVAFCAGHDIGLVVIGPEAPLVDGLADTLYLVRASVQHSSKGQKALPRKFALTQQSRPQTTNITPQKQTRLPGLPSSQRPM